MGDIGGRQGLKSSIRIKPKTTALGTDKTIIKEWLTNQPDVLQLQRKSTFEDIKGMLYSFLNPEAEASEGETTPAASEDEDTNDLPWEDKKPATNNYAVKNTGKVTKADKFDSVFEDEE